MRVKRGIVRHRRHKKIRKLAKGYEAGRSATYAKAKEAVVKAGQHAYMDRKKNKRNFRSLWIVRLNAAMRMTGSKYSVFISQLNKKGIQLDRKVLSELAIHQPETFKKLVDMVSK